MGLPTFVRNYLRTKYLPAFTFELKSNPTIAIYDLMQDLKYLPDEITTLDSAINFFISKIKAILYKNGTSIRTIIVLVDRKPPPVKRMVTHGARYKDKDVLKGKGPFLPENGNDLIPTPWIRFAGNYKLLQRELYPRLFNAFIDGNHIVPKPGQSIILHGFPGISEWVTVYKQQPHVLNTNFAGQELHLHKWNVATELPLTKEREQNDPDLYNRIYIIENVAPSPQFPVGYMRKEEWVEAKNDISEADGAMFFYDHWFQNDEILFMCNDGDVFAYGLAYSSERVTMNNTFRNVHRVRIPNKTVDDFFEKDDRPKYEYVDFNALYCMVKEDPEMKAAGVQNHVMTLVFLMIMAESDFFKGHMKGVGKDKFVWKTFLSSMSVFRHMVQSSKGVVPSTRTPRAIYLDEDLFRIFVNYCYVEKYGKSARKSLKRKPDANLTYDELAEQCKKGANAQKDAEYHMPSRNKIRLWSRQVLWNLYYYRNTPFGNEHSPDPFEKLDDLPYYPYVMDEKTGKYEMSNVVCARQKPIDEVFAQHLYRNRRKRTNGHLADAPTDETKKRLIDAFDK